MERNKAFAEIISRVIENNDHSKWVGDPSNFNGVSDQYFRMSETGDYGITGTFVFVNPISGDDSLPVKYYYGATANSGNHFKTLNAACLWANRSGDTYIVIQVLNTSAGSRHVLTSDAVIKSKLNVSIIGNTFASPAYLDLSTFRIIGANSRLSLGRLNTIWTGPEPILAIDGGIVEVMASTFTFPNTENSGLFWASNGVFHIGDRVTINFGANGQSLFNPKANYGGKCVFNTHALAAPTFVVGGYTGLLWSTGDRSFETFFSNAIALVVPPQISMINSINYYNQKAAYSQTVYDLDSYNYALSLGTANPLKFIDLTALSANGSFNDLKFLALNEAGKVIPFGNTLWDYWNQDYFMPTPNPIYLSGTAITSGTIAVSTDDLNYLQHGLIIRSSASANSGYRYGQSAVKNFFGGIALKTRVAIMPKTSHTARVIIAGWANTSLPTAEPLNGCYFWIVDGLVTAKTSQASTRTASGTTYSLTINKPYIFDVEVNAAATSARFRIYNELNEVAVFDQTITTNIPTGIAQGVMPVVGGIHTGAAISDICNIYKLGFGTVNGYLKS